MATYRAPECHMPPFWRIHQDGHFCLLIGPKNTILEEDVRILLSVKFHWIPFSSFRGKVENASANQRLGRPSCFFWLALLPVKLVGIRFSGFWISEEKSKNVSANQRSRRLSCFFLISPKNAKLVEDVEILLPIQFSWIPFSGVRGEVKNTLCWQHVINSM